MATLTTQKITRAGLEATYASAAGGGDSFTPSANTLLHVKNAGAGDITVTIDTPGTAIADVALANPAIVVTLAEERFIGPFPYSYFAQTDGLADITYSGVTSVTIAVFELSQP